MKDQNHALNILTGTDHGTSSALVRHFLIDLWEWTNSEWAAAVMTVGGSRTPVVTVGNTPDEHAYIGYVLANLTKERSMCGQESPGLIEDEAELPTLIVPIYVTDDLRAGLAFGPKRSGRGYTAADRLLIAEASAQLAGLLQREVLAGRVVHRMIDLRRTQEEMTAARDVQECFLPAGLVRVKGVEYHGDWRPARELGGDFFDFIPRAAGLTISIGDVAGKGIPAAIVMAATQASLRVLASARGVSCAAVVNELNRVVCAVTPYNLYATLFYARIDAEHLLYRWCE